MGPPTLKRLRNPAETRVVMTTSTPVLQTWATRPLGKAARVALAVLGMILATLVLMTAAIIETGAWARVILGAALAAGSVMAARFPSAPRLMILGAIVLMIPLAHATL